MKELERYRRHGVTCDKHEVWEPFYVWYPCLFVRDSCRGICPIVNRLKQAGNVHLSSVFLLLLVTWLCHLHNYHWMA